MNQEEGYLLLYRYKDDVKIKWFQTNKELKSYLADSGIYNYCDSTNIPKIEYFPASTALIVKGSIIQPKAVKVVTEIEIE